MPSPNKNTDMLFDVEHHRRRLRTIAVRCTETVRNLGVALDAIKDTSDEAKRIVDDLLDTMTDASEAAAAVDAALARRQEDAANPPVVAVPVALPAAVDACTCGTPQSVHTPDCPRYHAAGGSDDYTRKQVYGR